MECFEEGCTFHFIENQNGLIKYKLHRIIKHNNTDVWVDRRTQEFNETLVAILEKTKENETKNKN